MTVQLFTAAHAARTEAKAEAEAALKAKMAEPATVAAAQKAFKAIDAFIVQRFSKEYFAQPSAQQNIAVRFGYNPATQKAWEPAVAAAVAGMITALGGFAECAVYHREALMGNRGETTTYVVVAESAEAAKAVPPVDRANDLSDPWPFKDNRRPG